MGIQEILNSNLDIANIKVELTLKELMEFADQQRESSPLALKTIEPLLTQDEVINILKVDSTTLWRWNNRRYLLSFKIGGKVRYRQADITAFIKREGGEAFIAEQS